jgi:hypothetical protein
MQYCHILKFLLTSILLIVLKNDPDDKRVKYILPILLCEKYFKQMEYCLNLASKPQK